MATKSKSRKLGYLPWAGVTIVLALLLGPGLVWVQSGLERAEDPGSGTADVFYDVVESDPLYEAVGGPDGSGLSSEAESESGKEEGVRMAFVAPERPEAEEGSAEQAGGYDCIIEPFERITVGTAETGILQQLHAHRGDVVESGQLLAELESQVEEASVRLARERAQQSADVRLRETQLKLSSRRKERAAELARGDILSADARDEIDTSARISKLELDDARGDRRLAALALDKSVAQLQRREIRSPIGGVVIERLRSPGEVVKEEGILTVAQIDPLRVEVILPAGMFGTIQEGMRAEIAPEAPARGSFIAQVARVDRVIDPASSTFGVQLDLPNSDYAIPSGLHCQVRFLRKR